MSHFSLIYYYVMKKRAMEAFRVH